MFLYSALILQFSAYVLAIKAITTLSLSLLTVLLLTVQCTCRYIVISIVEVFFLFCFFYLMLRPFVLSGSVRVSVYVQGSSL